jgi:translation initiation factor IF-2
MRVYEVAKDLTVSSEALVQLLREMKVPVTNHMSSVEEVHVAKVRTLLERERRHGHETPQAQLEAAIEDQQSSAAPRRRRRRRKEDEAPAETAEATEAAAGEGAEAEPATPAEEAAAPAEEAEPEEAPIAAEAPAEAPTAAEPEAAEVEEAAPEAPAVEEEKPEEIAAEAPAEPEAEEAPAERTLPKPSDRPAPPRAGRMPPRPAAAEEARKPRPAPRKPAPPRPAAEGMPAERAGRVRVQAEGFTSDGRRQQRTAGKKGKKKSRVDQDAVEQNIRRTMAAMESGGGKKKRRSTRDAGPSAQERREAEQEARREEEATTVRVNEFLTVAELSEMIDVSPTQIVASAFKNLGLMVTINQRLDFDQIELLLEEHGFQAVREEEYSAEEELEIAEDRPEDLRPRPPVVTVMGHVDHGKTSLLDYIRKENVIAGEAGGITQHIGAYHVEVDGDRSLTFLDTPGHAAFTAMRARGAEVTDVVILVVAADDSVMPQTIEAVSHAKNAGVPIVVAVNKTDLPDANPMRVKQDLLQHQVVLEEFGGDVLSADVSAKTGAGLDDLLEKVLLQAEILDLKANADREAHGVVIESRLDVGKGPVATVLVTNGTLNVGDDVVCGLFQGRIRAMLDERGKQVDEAGPSTPVQVLGLAGVPQAGDQLVQMAADRAAEIAQTRQRLEREKRMRIKGRGVKLTDISKMLERGETAQLNLVIKGDVDGSVQALSDSLEQLSTEEVSVQVVHRAVGAINESDVLLASTSEAIVIGFHVRPTAEARQVAEREGVDIRLYNIIYEAVEEIRSAMEGMLSPEEREVLLGAAQVRELFKVPKIGTVAGCMVTEGEIRRAGLVRVVRDGIQVYEGRLDSLKRFKDDVREVREGFECGMSVANFNDIKVGDVIESYEVQEFARTLSAAE